MISNEVYIVASVDDSNGIGLNGERPWNFSGERVFFDTVTTKAGDGLRNMIVLDAEGLKNIGTGDLGGRLVVFVGAGGVDLPDEFLFAGSVADARELADETVDKIFVVGGMDAFTEAMEFDDLSGIYLTRVEGDFGCDAFFPGIPADFADMDALGAADEGGVSFIHLLLKR